MRHSPIADEPFIPPQFAARQWRIALRWRDVIGEFQVNVIRVVAMILLYGAHLWHFRRLAELTSRDRDYHRMATLLAVLGIVTSLAVLIAIRRHYVPHALKYLTTGYDLFAITFLVFIGGGYECPLVPGYFVVLALSGLRYSRMFIGTVTVATIGCYLGGVIPRSSGWDPTATVTVTMNLVCLALTGVVIWRMADGAHGISRGYFRRMTKRMFSRG
jgi:hypothetical protein